jgi:hypothetical protein
MNFMSIDPPQDLDTHAADTLSECESQHLDTSRVHLECLVISIALPRKKMRSSRFERGVASMRFRMQTGLSRER